jgi:hypothetical protein
MTESMSIGESFALDLSERLAVQAYISSLTWHTSRQARIVQLEGRSTEARESLVDVFIVLSRGTTKEGVSPETKHGQREGLLTVKMGYATFVKDDNRL